MMSQPGDSGFFQRETKEEGLNEKGQERAVRAVGGESGGTGDLESIGRTFWGRSPVLGVKLILQSHPGFTGC